MLLHVNYTISTPFRLRFYAIAAKELIYVDSDLTLFYIHWCEFTQAKCTAW